MKDKRIRKDRIFIIVIAIVVANLGYQLIKAIDIVWRLGARGWFFYFLIAINIIAIIGALWLLQNYRMRRRLEKRE